jgi:S1-C subfamily serine protease
VPAPNKSKIPAATVDIAQRSVVKILGEAPDCRQGQEGSGVVVHRERVVTNAHVVAGVQNPTVQVGGVGRKLPAKVVFFDARRDLAVLAVPGLRAKPLPLAKTDLPRAADALVAGFPRNGAFQAGAARVRSVITAVGEDIYGGPGVTREVYSLYADVEPGNSGGPLLTTRGEIAGIVFARSLDDARTGYALTVSEISSAIATGREASAQVSTGGCASG